MRATSNHYHGININYQIPDQCEPSRLYLWEIISGPDCLMGRIVRRMDMQAGGWHDGEIHYRNTRSGEIRVVRDSVEEMA